jgi:hypothetical protein
MAATWKDQASGFVYLLAADGVTLSQRRVRQLATGRLFACYTTRRGRSGKLASVFVRYEPTEAAAISWMVGLERRKA